MKKPQRPAPVAPRVLGDDELVQATGGRMHKPFTITHHVDQSTPPL